MKSVLLSSKLTPPAVPRHAVDRMEICNQIFLSFAAKVVLIRAPAGFGKTTVMVQLLERYRQEGTTVAWLSLDEADNDLPRFFSYISIALNNQTPVEAAQTAVSAAIGTGELTAHLTHQLLHGDAPFVLFLDEIDVIRDPAVLAFIRQLITQLPVTARLVLGSRNIPEIGLARLRAHAQLLEIFPEQLRFSAAEAQLFLTQRRGLPLKPEQVQQLLLSTEGWPTALWLASVALERRTDAEQFIAGFAGSDAAVADYLAEDVLAGQSDDVRDFLLKTSILAQLDAPLCDAVCQRNDSAAMLDRLDRSNLFVSLVNEAQGSYRYHSLFRDFLRAQLASHAQAQIPQLHRAAAQWFLEQDRPIPAIDHALATGDAAFALPLLEQHAEPLLNQGRLRLLTRWLESLPLSALDSSPSLRAIHIWAVSLSRGPQEALDMIEHVDLAKLSDNAVQAQFNAMRPTLLGMRDRIDESYALGTERILLIKPEFAFPYAMLSQALANDSMILGHYADARRYADQAQTAQTGYSSMLQMGLAGAVNGSIDLIQGRLRQALAELKLATGITDDGLVQNSRRNLLPGVILAEALYEAGQLHKAEELLNLYVPLTQNLGLPDQLIIAHSVLARLAQRQNDPDRMLDILTQLESLGHRLNLRRVVASARIEKANAFLLRGDSQGAKAQLQQAGDESYWLEIAHRSYIANDKITLAIGRLRWMVSSGEAAQAIAPLKQSLAEAQAAQRNRRALKLRILLAEALYLDDQRKPGLRMLAKALEFGAHEGFASSFLDEGPKLQAMLLELLSSRQAETDSREQDVFNALLLSLTTNQSDSTPTAAPEGGLAEALTRKELQILELVSQGFSNIAMAEKLFVSESTVRTHLRSINTKLQASNRMHAVAIARQMQLIA